MQGPGREWRLWNVCYSGEHSSNSYLSKKNFKQTRKTLDWVSMKSLISTYNKRPFWELCCVCFISFLFSDGKWTVIDHESRNETPVIQWLYCLRTESMLNTFALEWCIKTFFSVFYLQNINKCMTSADGKAVDFAKFGKSSKCIEENDGHGVGKDSRTNFVYSG